MTGVVPQLVAGGSLRLPKSWQEWADLGETKHAEYDDGLVVVNPPTRRNSALSARLTVQLAVGCPPRVEVLPEAGWAPSEHTVFEPDLMVVAVDAPAPDLLRVAPLLVVEILSPCSRGEDLGRKADAYAAGGVGTTGCSTRTRTRSPSAGWSTRSTASSRSPARPDCSPSPSRSPSSWT